MTALNSYEPIDFKDYSGGILLNSSAVELLKMVHFLSFAKCIWDQGSFSFLQ